MKPIKIGLAGLGNVGEEVAYQLIKGFRVQNDQFQIELLYSQKLFSVLIN